MLSINRLTAFDTRRGAAFQPAASQIRLYGTESVFCIPYGFLGLWYLVPGTWYRCSNVVAYRVQRNHTWL